MFANLSWKIIHQVLNETIAELMDEQQTLDVPTLRERLLEMAESETDELMVLCYWQASKVLMRLPPTVTASQLIEEARVAYRSPLNHDPL
ncbi:hypothetical protein AC790_21190 [Pantoea sp. RIT-PI-b]|uniref:hypothetical protein n=1 Tax=unclassified Pantoea TaxID=2630326 RepID=UPI0002712578|nr:MULTISPECIES: hypothetical protein [unclassified Pantoea]EJL88867.1 hypothetical protein PMI17_02507 [Pantoea sp. GM01]KNC05550.1 hypothetical protein AC790_21190 [Pantoea sp. RIT-PI-b]